MKLLSPFSVTFPGLAFCVDTLLRRGLYPGLTPAHQTRHDGPQVAIASPMPTAAPSTNLELLRRADGDSICGYISGVKTFSSAVGCNVDWTCFTEAKLVGCSKYGEEEFLPTACYDRGQLPSPTDTNTNRFIWCTWDPAWRYCATGTYTDTEYSGVTFLFCNDVAGILPISYSPSKVTQIVTQSALAATITKEGETKIVTQSAEVKTIVKSGGQDGGATGALSLTTTASQGNGGGAGRVGGGSSNNKDDSNKSAGSAESGAPATASPTADGSASTSFPIATVVGGAIGGIAIIGVLALAFFIVIRREKQKGHTASIPHPATGGTGIPLQVQRHSTYHGGLEVIYPAKQSPSPPSSTSSLKPEFRDSAAFASPSPTSPVQQQREFHVQPLRRAQQHPYERLDSSHSEHRQSKDSVLHDPRVSQHVELSAHVRSRQQASTPQVSTQRHTMLYGAQTTFEIYPMAEMPVERGDGELRELGQYR